MKRYFHLLFDENASGTGGAAAPSGGDSGGTTGAPSTTEGGGAPDSGAVPSGEPAGAPEGFSSSDPFEGMDDDYDSIDLGLATAPSSDPKLAAPQAPPVKPAAQPEVVPPVKPEAPVVQPPAANAPASARSPLEEMISGFKANEGELAKWAGANLFKLSPEDADLLTTNAEEVIPRLMGQVYTQALAAAGNLIRNFVPQMIAQGVETTTSTKARAQEALQEFYSSNPHLSAKDHQPVVDKWAKVFRAANPKASRAEAIKFVGNAVSLELGISPSQASGQRPAQPFAPARPGARQPTQQVVDDPFAGLDQDFD